MAGSNFLEFNPTLANAQTDVEYTADASRTGGLSDGIADTEMHNKLFRQVSVMVAALGAFIEDEGAPVEFLEFKK